MKQFPFHTKPKFNADLTEAEMVIVGNEIVGTIQIPSIKSWTVNENLAFLKAIEALEGDGKQKMGYRQMQVCEVATILRSRKPEFADWTDQDFIDCLTTGLLDLLYEFTESELDAWKPKAKPAPAPDAEPEDLGESGPTAGGDSPPPALTNDSILKILETNLSGSLPEKLSTGSAKSSKT